MPDKCEHRKKDESDEPTITPHRIMNLSDGVFSIVMTLLVLDIKIPSHTQVSSSVELIDHLYSMLPKFQYYFITFIVLGIFWVGHHYQFQFIKRSDNRLVWLNLFFMMFITLIPFTTYLLGEYPNIRIASGIYALNILITGLLVHWNWRYATKNCRLTDCHFDNEMISYITEKNQYTAIILLAAVILVFFNFQISFALYAIIPFIHWHYKLPRKNKLQK
ncbi:MAG: DUF1211 domain-containing protein [Firmicutes bacterium]|nr:DUF1211 domain-containing protein [Bacillota bacterium]